MKKIIGLMLVIFLLFFVSGCVKQEPQPDKDLSNDDLNNIWETVENNGTSFGLYTIALSANLGFFSVSKPVPSNLIEKLPTAKSVDKLTIEANWQGPDADGWYTQTSNNDYVKVRYYSSLKKLEFKSRTDLTDILGFIVEENGSLIFNKNIRDETEGAYPVSGSVSIYFLAPSTSDPNKMNKFGFTLSFSNVGITYLSQFKNIGILTGSMSLYVTLIDYDNNINVNNKLMASFTSQVQGADSEDPVLVISGSKDKDGDPTTDDGYDNFELNLHLAKLLL
ncbi:LptM family lipoprotein [Dictyoglomus thermophilum]|uniref:Lipoprotein, putative n=1 Tax=Dictyoglomus thermophilum (strain ATCC 35947 / DSM 3960 / H-6-12) TaxID=309799 RepID=B5YCV5_DICT6|nr:hypothetical protein [Dictyoglomus thermophilum]ACI18294.1 lipoprotein, putative [Dictyoglomus thermophilum H-6-12]